MNENKKNLEEKLAKALRKNLKKRKEKNYGNNA